MDHIRRRRIMEVKSRSLWCLIMAARGDLIRNTKRLERLVGGKAIVGNDLVALCEPLFRQRMGAEVSRQAVDGGLTQFLRWNREDFNGWRVPSPHGVPRPLRHPSLFAQGVTMQAARRDGGLFGALPLR